MSFLDIKKEMSEDDKKTLKLIENEIEKIFRNAYSDGFNHGYKYAISLLNKSNNLQQVCDEILSTVDIIKLVIH